MSIEAAARDARYAALAARIAAAGMSAHGASSRGSSRDVAAAGAARRRRQGHVGDAGLPCARGEAGTCGRCSTWRTATCCSSASLSPPRSIDPMNQDLRFDRVYLRTAVWPLIADALAWRGDSPGARGAAYGGGAAAAGDGGGCRRGPPSRRRCTVDSRLENFAAVEARQRSPFMVEPGRPRSAFDRAPREALRQVFDAEADHQPAVVLGLKRCGAIVRGYS